MRNLTVPLFFGAFLGSALLLGAGCGDSGPKVLSPDQYKANAREQIDAINKRSDIPAAAKEQIIGHIQQNLRHDLSAGNPVPPRKNSGG